MIDIDCKYDLTGNLWENFSGQIKDHNSDLFDKLVCVKTPSGGYHLIYRVEKNFSKNGKLANRATTAEELEITPHLKTKVLIEIKAEGGYCLAPPSKDYVYISEKTEPSIISEDERDLILTLARGFNEVFIDGDEAPKKIKDFDDGVFIENPFQAYNKKGDVIDELKKTGGLL